MGFLDTCEYRVLVALLVTLFLPVQLCTSFPSPLVVRFGVPPAKLAPARLNWVAVQLLLLLGSFPTGVPSCCFARLVPTTGVPSCSSCCVFLSLHIHTAQCSLLRAVVLTFSILSRTPPPFLLFFAFALFYFRPAFCSFARHCLRYSSRPCCLCSVTSPCSRSLTSFWPVNVAAVHF
jgi:hypothetical protein